jgi:HSP20 family protein
MNALSTFRPRHSLARFERDFENVFDHFFAPRARGQWAPAADIVEEDERYVVRMDLPGLKRDDIAVSVENNHLTVRGTRKVDEEEKDRNFLRSERYRGEFVRSFRLGNRAAKRDIQASYIDGVLEVSVPKAEEAKPQTIEVK